MRINKHQLFCMIVLFQIGSTTLFALGIGAKQDAWIAIIIAMLAGFILLFVYVKLQKFFPKKNLSDIITILLGKIIGVPLVLLYILYFIYIGSVNYREFCELILLTYLDVTPLLYVQMILIFVVIYLLFCGLQVFARTSEIAMPFILIFIFSIYFFIILSGRLHFEDLKPVLGDGLKPVLNAAFPLILNFPFGEMVVFLMYWCYVDNPKDIKKTSFLAVLLSGSMLVISLIVIVSVLGVSFASVSTIPILQVIRVINVEDFITNLDAIGSTIIFIGGFYKMTTFFYGGIIGVTTLFKIRNNKLFIFIASICLLTYSYNYVRSFPEHIWIGRSINSPYIHNSMQIYIPMLLLAIAWIKKKRGLI